jgi:hypothetical protein
MVSVLIGTFGKFDILGVWRKVKIESTEFLAIVITLLSVLCLSSRIYLGICVVQRNEPQCAKAGSTTRNITFQLAAMATGYFPFPGFKIGLEFAIMVGEIEHITAFKAAETLGPRFLREVVGHCEISFDLVYLVF